MKKLRILIIVLLVVLASVSALSGVYYMGKYNDTLDALKEHNNLREQYTNLAKEYNDIQEQWTNQKEKLEEREIELEEWETSQEERFRKKEAELEKQFQTFRDSGIQIFDGIQPDAHIGEYWTDKEGESRVKLQNNPMATNPTFSGLMNFLERDNTDSLRYHNDFLCGGFAQTLHNNAEKEGIKAAFVKVWYTTDGHALNAFNTTDKGLVYIDCTGEGTYNPFPFQLIPPVLPVPVSPWTITYTIGKASGYDTIAYVQKDRPIGWVNIHLSYGLKYSEYERWQNDVENIKREFEDAHDYKLAGICNEANYKLGGFFTPGDVVTSIKIYW